MILAIASSGGGRSRTTPTRKIQTQIAGTDETQHRLTIQIGEGAGNREVPNPHRVELIAELIPSGSSHPKTISSPRPCCLISMRPTISRATWRATMPMPPTWSRRPTCARCATATASPAKIRVRGCSRSCATPFRCARGIFRLKPRYHLIRTCIARTNHQKLPAPQREACHARRQRSRRRNGRSTIARWLSFANSRLYPIRRLRE